MSSLSRELLERISGISEWAAAVFGALAAISAVTYLLANKPLRKIEARENLVQQEKTALAQADSAKAQLALKQYVDVVAKSRNERQLDSTRFVELLKGKPKGSVEIWYEPTDPEAWHFASDIGRWLGPEGAGWEVSKIQPFPVEPEPTYPLKKFSLRAAAASTGLAIAAKKDEFLFSTAEGALKNAINLAAGGWGMSGLEWSMGDATLPDNHFVIAVGRQHANVPLVQFTPSNKP